MYKIGFTAEMNQNEQSVAENTATQENIRTVRKSVVEVYFPSRHFSCSYYNDEFDLKRGDVVYVDGKLEGLQGRVTDINYTFKIKLSDYKRVIGVADTNVSGELFMANSHFVATERTVIPYEKVITWFKAPEEEEFESSATDEAFALDDLSGMQIDKMSAERGRDYYMENRVAYIEVKDGRGRAIVRGTKPYEVEFSFRNGEISGLVCNCYCTGTCKHEFATMLQLRETLKVIGEEYGDNFGNNYLAVINKAVFFEYAVDNKTKGSLKLA